MSRFLNYVMFAMITLLAISAVWLDRQDWECPDLYSPRSECSPGIGMPIRNTKPSENDSPCQILQKIDRAAQAERQNIKWRQSIYLAIIINFAIFVLVVSPGHLPTWPTFFTSSIIVSSILYFHLNWYSYHRYSFAEDHIHKNVVKLQKNNNCNYP